jgi:glycosyltransferase involved in cell wall biosynthesis
VRVAMVGQKGIPATHGGVERHVQELAVRLVASGHRVVVYNRSSYVDHDVHDCRGVRVVTLPSLATKHLDTITHVALCTAHALRHDADIVHYHAVGPALLSWVPRLQGTGVVVTIHGQDWRRPKWGRAAATALRAGEWMAMHAPDRTIVVSESLSQKLSRDYGRDADFIPNGITLDAEEDPSILGELGLEPGKYVFFASRLVPEKGAHYLVEAHRRIGTELPLVIAGDSSFSSDYVRTLHAGSTGDGVVFPGYVYGPRLAALFKNAALFVLPSDIEGLPIVLLEALGYGTPVLASDIPPNREVLGDLGRTFRAGDVDDLAQQLVACLGELPALSEQARKTAATIGAAYDWDVVTAQTLAVYESVLSATRG